MINPEYVYSINPSVDVYKIGNDILELYFISSRRRVTLKVTLPVINTIQSLNGKATILEICSKNFIELSSEVFDFLNYLINENIIYCVTTLDKDRSILSLEDRERYDRQLNYFDSMFARKSFEIQRQIQDETILIFGVGAVGSTIALQLLMSGVRNFILVDKDHITPDSLQRHFSFKTSDIGKPKVQALYDYLKAIDSSVNCQIFQQIIDYDTAISDWLENSTFVINTLDEPYIGITSLKIGRECYKKKIPLYIAGGFDAHLMSTGELIIPNRTPCVDCYTNFFSQSLKEWKPQYNLSALQNESFENNQFEVGGLASMTLFSASYGTMTILNYFATNGENLSLGRGELLFDKLEINYLNVKSNPKCNICGSI